MAGLRWMLAGLFCLGSEPLLAGHIPLPPSRGGVQGEGRVPNIGGGQGQPAPPSPDRDDGTTVAPRPGDDPNEAVDCVALLASGKIKAERQASISGMGGCGIGMPVRVAEIATGDGRHVTLEPPPVLRCGFADALADWVRDDLAPLLASRGSRLVRMTGTNGYECRERNRIAGAKLSEHASGNAIDIRAFGFADGTVGDITKTDQAIPLFAQIKLTACARFSTVLGPGSDGYHEDNLHLDLELRRNDALYCHWQLP